MQLGVGVLAIDRHQPVSINEKIEELGLDRSRLLIGVGAGFSEKPLTAMREAHDELREAIPGVKLVLAAMGPKMCALAGILLRRRLLQLGHPRIRRRGARQRRGGRRRGRPRDAPRLRLRPHLGRRRRRDPPRQGGGLLPRPPRRLPPPVRAPRPAAGHRRRRRREPRRRRRDAQRLRGPRHDRRPRPGQRQAGCHGPGGDGSGAQITPGRSSASRPVSPARGEAVSGSFVRPGRTFEPLDVRQWPSRPAGEAAHYVRQPRRGCRDLSAAGSRQLSGGSGREAEHSAGGLTGSAAGCPP